MLLKIWPVRLYRKYLLLFWKAVHFHDFLLVTKIINLMNLLSKQKYCSPGGWQSLIVMFKNCTGKLAGWAGRCLASLMYWCKQKSDCNATSRAKVNYTLPYRCKFFGWRCCGMDNHSYNSISRNSTWGGRLCYSDSSWCFEKKGHVSTTSYSCSGHGWLYR